MKVKEIRALSAAEMDEKVVSLKEELSVRNLAPIILNIYLFDTM